ncbi:MAG TPA: hypothetical protein VGF79_06640, partial [Bacteroidia bacterium]
MPTNVPIRKLRVWEDGKMEFDMGMIHLPRAVSIKIGPSELMINSLLFSSTKLYHNEIERNYNIIGFDGKMKISPGGVTVQGDGIKIYYTTDNGSGKPLHIFVRLEKLDLTIVVPEGAKKEKADFFLHGSLSIKNKDGIESYMGSVEFAVNKAKISGGATIEYTPKVPRWYIDAYVDLASGIPLGSTGLAIYGFSGLVGKGKRFIKDEEESWWKFYKKPTEGINYAKFGNEKGFALGLGVALATQQDDGKSFSSILTLILGLPDVVMFNGRAAFMSERVKFGDEDPPFSAMLAIDSKSIQTGLGVNMPIGNFVELNGSIEMAYFWKDASAWYINVGKDLPESDRIRAKVFSMFDAYAYLMLSASGIKFGAGAKWEFAKNIGVVGIGAKAYLDTYGRLSLRPTQIGGGIAMGGEAYAKLAKFKVAFSLAAYLQAEAPKPKQIKGGLDVKLELPKPLKSKGIHLEFSWVFDEQKLVDPLNIIEHGEGYNHPVQAVNMLNNETFAVNIVNGSHSSLDDYPVIPVDSYIDLSFANNPRLNLNSGNPVVIGGEVTAVNNRIMIPPQKGINEQVKHEFEINEIKIKAFNGTVWQDYNIFEASDTIKEIPEIAAALASNANYLKGLPQAYWQLKSEGKNSTLRFMSTNMFTYLNQSIEGSIVLEQLGYEGGVVFCEQSKIQNNVINWENENPGDVYTSNQYYNKDGVKIIIFGKDGAVNTVTNSYGLVNGLEFSESDGLEIVFGEPQSVVLPQLIVPSGDYLHIEYIGRETNGTDHNNFPIEKYITLRTDKLNSTQVATYNGYSDNEDLVYKIRITYYKTGMLNADHDSVLRIGYSTIPDQWYNSGNGILAVDDLMIIGKGFDNYDIYNIYNNGGAYSGGNIIAHWELNGNGNDASGNSHNGTAYNSPYPFPGRTGLSSNAYYLGRNGIISPSTARYFQVPHSAELSVGKENFCIMAWVRIPPCNLFSLDDYWYIGKKTIVSKMKKNDGGYQLSISGYRESFGKKQHTGLNFEYKVDDTYGYYIQQFYADCDDFMDGNWHHVAAVKTFGYDPKLGIET